MAKNQRIYTVFLLPNGDKIPISCRSENELIKFQNQYPKYELKERSSINRNEIKSLMNSVFTYNKNMKSFFGG